MKSAFRRVMACMTEIDDSYLIRMDGGGHISQSLGVGWLKFKGSQVGFLPSRTHFAEIWPVKLHAARTPLLLILARIKQPTNTAKHKHTNNNYDGECIQITEAATGSRNQRLCH